MALSYVIKSSNIFTSVPGTSGCISGAVGIEGERIACVGPVDEVMAQADAQTQVIDASDGIVCPGLVDTHTHFFPSAMNLAPTSCYHYFGTSAQDCVDALKQIEDIVPKDEVMYGFGWYFPVWDEPVLPNKSLLDAAYPDRPVVYCSADGHCMWLNSCALERFGITNDTPDPEGGCYERDENGELTGIVEEAASMSVMGKLFDEMPDTYATDAIKTFVAQLNAEGITGVGDVALSAAPGADMIREDYYKAVADEGALTVRVDMYPTALEDLSRADKLREEFPVQGGDFLVCRGLKQFFDGVAQLHTAWMIDEYCDEPGNFGRPTVDPEVMRRIVLHAAEKGYAVRIHAIGDRSIKTGLDIFEEAQATFGKPAIGRNGLEHLESIKPEDIGRLRDLEVIANVQPFHLLADPEGEEVIRGRERMKTMWPFREYVEQGVHFSLGTDSPVVPTDPRIELYSAVTRQNFETDLPEGGWVPEQRITAEQALHAYTYGSAYSLGREDELGTLEAGKLADITVFDTNLIACDPHDILSAKTVATFVGGRKVFEA